MKNDNQRYLILDFETRSKAPLRGKGGVGAFEYSVHSSTRILCVAWRIGTRSELECQIDAPIYYWSPYIHTRGVAGSLIEALNDPSIIKVAHNAYFEQVITQNVLTRYTDELNLKVLTPEHWMCTASMAAALALPRNLEDACLAVGLSAQKDMKGHRLMLKLSKPRKPTKHDSSVWHNKKSELMRLIEYCVNDIKAETELFLYLPELIPFEREVWILNQKKNLRGIKVDREAILQVLKMIAEETNRLNEETFRITGGEVPTTRKVAKLKNFLEDRCSLPLENLQAKTIEDTLKGKDLDPVGRRLLEIRQMISKTSTTKYEAFEARSRSDGIVRDIQLYHGASTGRDTGVGVQVHNFPRGTIKDTWEAVEIIRQGDLEFIRMLYGNPMEVFSSCLRSMIVARKGKKFNCGDFASIEVRKLFWLAGHEVGLKAYRDKKDLYRMQAMPIYKRPTPESVEKLEREVGKRAVLGCGYGMGKDKFLETCEQYGQPVSPELAARAVQAYREMHYPVPKLWDNLERAATSAIRNPGKVYTINKTSWWVAKNFLWCKLPSGRKLAYYKPTIKQSRTSWGQLKDTIHHWGVDPVRKKWQEQKTWGGVLTENVDQASSRDLMVMAELRLEKAGYIACMSVHDELLTESENGNVKEFTKLMAEVPAWAAGMPIEVEAWEGSRYRK